MYAFWEIMASNALLAAALAAAVALVGRLWKNPAALHLLWMCVLLKLITPPLVIVPVPLSVSHATLASEEQGTFIMDVPDESVPQAAKGKAVVDSRKRHTAHDAEIASAEEPGASTARSAVEQHGLPWLTILACLWVVGTTALTCRYGWGILRFLKLLRAGEQPPRAVGSMAERLSKRLGLRRVPDIIMLPVRVSPLVWFVGLRPCVVLPSALFDRLDRGAQETILAHELAHLRRNDHWVRLLELLVAIVFWWHPVVWWARRQLQQLEEQCCDGLVLRTLTHDARTYATALLDTLDFLSDVSVAVPVGAAAAWPSVYLARRISMLDKQPAVLRLTIGRLLLLLGAAAGPMTVALAAAVSPPGEPSSPAAQGPAAASPAATAIAGHVIQAKSVQYADVLAAVNQAADGDTVQVPAGTATWSQEIKITKGITLAGKTTTRGAGTKDATANDQTIVIDDAPKSPTLLTFNASKPFRLTGFTMRSGANDIPSGSVHAAVGLNGQQGVAFRMDNMHFDRLKRRAIWCGGWSIGVIDSTIIRTKGHQQSFYITEPAWNGQTMGNGAWADYPWLGTDKFVFVEDTSIFGDAQSSGGNIDNMAGARFVIRHTYFSQCTVSGHGTESGVERGHRCAEVYNNIFDWDGAAAAQGRSGTFIWHDNAWPTKMGKNTDNFMLLAVYRENMRAKTWGFAQGTNPWDQNDTEGDGSFVEGHPPKTFETGAATSDCVKDKKGVAFGDSSKHWKPGQWKGYSITNVSNPQTYFGMWIVDNTENTITYTHNWASDVNQGQWVKFAVGEKYEINRVVRALDQSGAGKGDLLQNVKGDSIINTVTGKISYPHQQQEICYEWNNTHTPTGKALKFNGGWNCSTKEGRDYVNLGNGRPANAIPEEVKNFYTAKVNGVAYVEQYTYPHPLRGGSAPTPPPSVSPGTR